MNEAEYDFFGTGGGTAPAPAAPPAVRPDAAPATATQHTYATPQGRVNQFGTPVDVAPTPTGPFAAAGIGAAPTSTPGMVSTWQGPPMHGAPARSAHGRAAAPRGSSSSQVPTNVRAVAVLALFFGLLGAIATWSGFSQYQQLRSLVDQTMAAEGPGAASPAVSDSLMSALLTVVLVGLVILAAVTVILLAGGAATLAGQRWGGWLLVVAYGLYLLGQVYSFAHGGFTLFGAIGVLIALVLLLVLVTGEGLRWLLAR